MAVGLRGRTLLTVIRRQQLQLFGNSVNQTFEDPHLFFHLLAVSLPLAVGDQPLDGVSRQVRDAAGATLFTNAAELTELVFRNSKINQALPGL